MNEPIAPISASTAAEYEEYLQRSIADAFISTRAAWKSVLDNSETTRDRALFHAWSDWESELNRRAALLEKWRMKNG